MGFRKVAEDVWELEPRDGMLVPGRVYAGDDLFERAAADRAVDQVANVAYLPGIVEASMAMPDVHWGYGFPIGGVAATDVDVGGVVSPGGVGFDICCGVRLLRSDLTEPDFRAHGTAIMAELDARIPRGLGKGAIARGIDLDDVLSRGAPAPLEAGHGVAADLERCEERGTSEGARPGFVTDKARLRGASQLGSLGAGNHFLEVQAVDRIVDEVAANAFGLAPGMVCVMIHCGSRGLGHQTCTDQLAEMGSAMKRHGITVPDRQLACVPVRSPEGERYLGAMAAAANFAWANRHVLAAEARRGFEAALGARPGRLGMRLVYDVAHNLAKLERHDGPAGRRLLCVHRKGATRALGPGDEELPADLREVGQPVLLPGSMGTASWVLRGVEGNPAFGSAAHGAGRVMSRKMAKQASSGLDVMRNLQGRGIFVRPGSVALLSEEAPYAYKDVDRVVEVCERTGLAAPVARLRPIGVVKG